MVVIEKIQLSKTPTFQLTFSKGVDEKSCVFENETERTSTFGGKISITKGLKFCIDFLHCKEVKSEWTKAI